MQEPTFSAFLRGRRLAHGRLAEVAKAVADHAGGEPVLVLEDASGRATDLDLRGSPEEIAARYAEPPPPASLGRGRPRLGVVAREVTLLPHHWAWLAEQPGGASAALRRLVDQARRDGVGQARRAQDAVHWAMTALAGDLPDYEEVLRAFHAGDDERLHLLTEAWPRDIADYVLARVAAARGAPAGGRPAR
jgi:uncharacterized protein